MAGALMMRSMLVTSLVMLVIHAHAAEISARTMAWCDAKHAVTGGLARAGIRYGKMTYNYVLGQYLLDLQSTPLTNLQSVAGVLKRYDFTEPPWLPFSGASRVWGAPHVGPCTLGINLCGTQVTNVGPLRGLPISLLWIAYTPFRDLSSLDGLPIKSLHIDATQIVDLAPLDQFPLEELFFEPFSITNGMSVLRQSRTLRRLNRMRAEDFWRWYDATLPEWRALTRAEPGPRRRDPVYSVSIREHVGTTACEYMTSVVGQLTSLTNPVRRGTDSGDASRAPLGTVSNAVRLSAAERANGEAQRRFGVRPFAWEDGELTMASNTWVWVAIRGIGRDGLEARVTIPRGGTNGTVELRRLVSIY